ncbi:hypothetical protein YPPY59_1849, partial [Yersinia pestis PY-59]
MTKCLRRREIGRPASLHKNSFPGGSSRT